jgi:hypothetical protein
MKLAPFTVKRKPGPPAVTAVGLTEVIAGGGTGVGGGGGGGVPPPPPQPAIKTTRRSPQIKLTILDCLPLTRIVFSSIAALDYLNSTNY